MPDNTTQPFDFDRIIDRRGSDSIKWRLYGDALPLWVADMDFAAPDAVLAALRARVEHGVFGYPGEPPALREVLTHWLLQRFGWRVAPEALVFLPGVVTGFNVACRATARPGEGVLVQTPVYPPMLDAAANFGLRRDEMRLTQGVDGRYTVDLDAFDAAISDDTRAFLLCSPHNPTGRVFAPGELAAMAEVCARRDVVICSDEIHGDLVLGEARHVPLASLDPEIGRRTITLMAPSKTFNIPGLAFSFAVVEDPALRAQFVAAAKDIVPHINVLGYVAALAAYTEGEPWLDACLRYLTANRDILYDFVASRLPGLSMARPEATYLAWLDCRGAALPAGPHKFFLRHAGVALNDGVTFGRGGEGFARLNFGCPRATLAEALERMAAALADRSAVETAASA